MNDLLWEPLIGVKSTDYVQTGTLSGTLPELGAYSVPLYAIRSAAVPPGGGRISTNRPGYHQLYVGFELNLTKRMSNRWMARLGLSTNSWTEHFDDPSVAIIDPTKAPAPDIPPRQFAGPQVDGGAVVRFSSGSGQSEIYMVAPAYQLAANGMYQARWGVSVGANLATRAGFAEPFFQSRVVTGDTLGRKTVLLARGEDDFRLPAVTSLDGRLEWKRTLAKTSLIVDVDVFNAFNASTVLGRLYDARFVGFDQPLEIMNPRTARLGFRLIF